MRFAIVGLGLLASCAHAQQIDWPTYGNDPGGTRYSRAAQITTKNVSELKPLWVYHTGALERAPQQKGKIAFEATPIFVDGTLYVSTPLNRIVALDAGTGKERWVYDPDVDVTADYSEVTSRGVAYWRGGSGSGPCSRRILEGTIDARLIAVDAATGRPCGDFGQGGIVNLREGIQIHSAPDYQVTSPPAIAGNVVVVGSAIGDNRGADLERGTVRGYDVRTGKLLWKWDPLPQYPHTGAANAWGVMSADAASGLVFVPTGSASPDFYGGERKGDNRNANSVTALRALTGEVVWTFQVVHHDLWDYDVASQPILVEVTRAGSRVPAVLVNTKMGHVFLLDRRTGKPLFNVEEKRVPASDVPGESASETQPFSTMDALVPNTLTVENAFGIDEAARKWCREEIAGLRSDGIFTPPSLKGTLVFPGNVGGVSWGGPAYDPTRHWMIVNTNRLATVVRLIPRADVDKTRRSTGENRLSYEFGRQEGTPYAMVRAPLITPDKVPCNPPPFGALTALDIETGRKVWEVPLGVYKRQPGTLNLGGPLATAGGLAFIAATMDNQFRAFDVATGKVLWETELPAAGHATPMTYIVKGKQYVVISAGGHGKLGTKMGDSVIAFGL